MEGEIFGQRHPPSARYAPECLTALLGQSLQGVRDALVVASFMAGLDI